MLGSGLPATDPTGVPHSLQNLEPGAKETPHAAHASASGVPQLLQNFAPAGCSEPQFGHMVMV